MTTAQAAAGMCSILWLVDGTDPSVQADRRALERFGQVADLGTNSPDRWMDIVGPFRPDGIATFSDNRMVELAFLAEALDLPFHKPVVARRLTDKTAQRDVLRRAGLSTPRTTEVGADVGRDDLRRTAADVQYPAVLKPVLGTDNRTTVRVDDAEQLFSALTSMFGQARPDMVVEDYLADTDPCLGEGFANYLSVESAVCSGRIDHFAVTGRFPPAPPLRESGFFIPADLTADQRTDVLNLATAAVDAIGVEMGFLHTEIKFTPDGPRIIEVNGRLGGGVPLMLEMAGAASAPRLAMEVALGRAADLTTLTPREGIAFRLLFHAPMTARRVLAVEGLERIGDLPSAPTATLHRQPGSEIDWRTGTNDYVYSVIGVAEDYDQLRTIHRMSEATVHMQFEETEAGSQANDRSLVVPR
jgi:biotin carboxylase